jgi:hypothetical protein
MKNCINIYEIAKTEKEIVYLPALYDIFLSENKTKSLDVVPCL